MQEKLRKMIERLNDKATDYGWPSCDAPSCIGSECEYDCERFDKSVAGHLFDASSALASATEHIAELEADVGHLRAEVAALHKAGSAVVQLRCHLGTAAYLPDNNATRKALARLDAALNGGTETP